MTQSNVQHDTKPDFLAAIENNRDSTLAKTIKEFESASLGCKIIRNMAVGQVDSIRNMAVGSDFLSEIWQFVGKSYYF